MFDELRVSQGGKQGYLIKRLDGDVFVIFRIEDLAFTPFPAEGPIQVASEIELFPAAGKTASISGVMLPQSGYPMAKSPFMRLCNVEFN